MTNKGHKINIEYYADKYFLRSKLILEKERLNPWVKMQVFVRKGPGITAGIDEAVETILKNSDIVEQKGTIRALPDGSPYEPKQVLMEIIAPIQHIIALETIYLGVISKAITEKNDKTSIDLKKIKERAHTIKSLIGEREVSYFGARHWHYENDAEIARAAFEGGFSDASTDAGASSFGKVGIGTIPHALEAIYDWRNGVTHVKESPVVSAIKAFDKHMSEEIKRIALSDYFNREISDALRAVHALPFIYGVREDTCGENVAEGAAKDYTELKKMFSDATLLALEEAGCGPYLFGRGVTISGVYALREALDRNDCADKKIILTSGFGDVKKVKAFVDAEKILAMRLFDSLGVGGLFSGRFATADIVGVGSTAENLLPYAKVGRAEQYSYLESV